MNKFKMREFLSEYGVILAVASFLTGVVAQYFGLAQWFLGLMFFLLLVGWVLCGHGNKKKLALLMITFGLLGLWRGSSIEKPLGRDDAGYYAGLEDAVVIEGLVSDRVEFRDSTQRFFFEAERLEAGGFDYKVSGKILIVKNRYPPINYGDKLILKGSLKVPFENEDFSYKNYLSLFKVHSVMYFPQLLHSEHGDKNLLSGVFAVRTKILDWINLIYTEPHSSFMAGLLLGARQGLPEEITERMNRVGLLHVLVISGYNISLVILMAGWLFGFFSRKVRISLTIGLLMFFVLIVGPDASVVRAAIMGTISVMALWYGRSVSLLRSIFAAAFVMVLLNPASLIHDLGFKLSFAATLGVSYLGPLIQSRLQRYLASPALSEVLALTLGAQLAVLPVILAGSGQVALVSPLSNLLVAPLVPAAMLLGAVSLVLAPISMSVARLLGYPAWFCLELILQVAKLLE